MKYIRVDKEQNAVHIAKTQMRAISPEGAKIHELLAEAHKNADRWGLSAEELEVLEMIKNKVTKQLPKGHLRVAR